MAIDGIKFNSFIGTGKSTSAPSAKKNEYINDVFSQRAPLNSAGKDGNNFDKQELAATKKSWNDFLYG